MLARFKCVARCEGPGVHGLHLGGGGSVNASFDGDDGDQGSGRRCPPQTLSMPSLSGVDVINDIVLSD
jgi:hypothetical protein